MKRVPSRLLESSARTVTDRQQSDEMAGPSYLHAISLVRWLFWKRLEIVAELLARRVERHESGLDFGCGLGVLLPTLSETTAQVYATDLELRPARRLASELHIENVYFLESSELWQKITPGLLDYVVSTDVLEHVDDLPGIVTEFAKALKTGGRLVVSGPTENYLYKLGRVLAGFGGKGDYHHTDIHRIHRHIIERREFEMVERRILPIPYLLEAFHIYSYKRL